MTTYILYLKFYITKTKKICFKFLHHIHLYKKVSPRILLSNRNCYM